MSVVAEAKLAMDGIKLALDGIKMLQSGKASAEIKSQLGQVWTAMLNAQEHASAAYARETDLTKTIRELEEKLADFKTWDTEKQRYELKRLPSGAFAYAVKESERGVEPAHYICQPCYERREKRVFQPTRKHDMGALFACPQCKLILVLPEEE